MSDDIAIRVSHLGKKYRIWHHMPERYVALRDVIARSAVAPFHRLARAVTARRLRANCITRADKHEPVNSTSSIRETLTENFPSNNRPSSTDLSFNGSAVEDFWALRDVSFEVKRGEVVGIIGRNGAGKSTLLKILSRITEPTTGEIEIEGRVASLLEVGTGFHPELTGRENIFLNGAILGMTRAEIARRFDEIVAFAEVDKFLDTPVKHFSSGMYVRLAFAVAAHLEPDILIVDEVLAVGDAAFQQKCLGRMDVVAKTQGRTVLFVSHNMAAIRQLCTRGIMLDSGKLCIDGLPEEVAAKYFSDARRGRIVELDDWKDRKTSGEARITKIEITDSEGGMGCVTFGNELVIRIHTMVYQPLQNPIFGVLVSDSMGGPLLDLRSPHDRLHLKQVTTPLILEMRVPKFNLYPGRYFLSPWIADSTCRRDIDYPHLCCVLDVLPGPTEHSGLKLDPLWGRIFVESKWKAEQI